MVKKVLKFGGTSVGTIDRIMHVAKIIEKEHSAGNKIIAIVSAMAGKTNELIDLSNKISDEFEELLVKVNVPGIHAAVMSGVTFGLMLVGTVTLTHNCVVGDPHCSDSVTQYVANESIGVTLNDCPVPIVVPFFDHV